MASRGAGAVPSSNNFYSSQRSTDAAERPVPKSATSTVNFWANVIGAIGFTLIVAGLIAWKFLPSSHPLWSWVMLVKEFTPTTNHTRTGFDDVVEKLEVYVGPLRKQFPYLELTLYWTFTLGAIVLTVIFIGSAVRRNKERQDLGKVYVSNRVSVKEFADPNHTVKEVTKLLQSREFKAMKEEKGKNLKQWNWQSRREDHPEDEELLWGGGDGDSDGQSDSRED